MTGSSLLTRPTLCANRSEHSTANQALTYNSCAQKRGRNKNPATKCPQRLCEATSNGPDASRSLCRDLSKVISERPQQDDHGDQKSEMRQSLQ